MSQANFSQLSLNPSLLQNLEDMGYANMTPIQQQSLPLVLAGKDVIAQGKTGSGKTAAFSLGLLNQLDVKRFYVQSLVLCPTRELADQVAKEIRKLARAIHNIKVLTLCGGMPFGPQIGSLEHGAHIIVGTPGRIEEHVRKGTLQLDRLTTLVLDEADRMLEMGFQDALDAIIEHTPKDRQTLLFSATYPEQIQAIAQRVMQQPEMVKVEGGHDHSNIKQHFYKVQDNKQRLVAVKLLLLKHKPESTVVFCSTKRETQEVCDELVQAGFAAVALHGDLEQKQRDQTLVRFANKSASILVATDVAARGLDVDALDCVINYQIARDPEVHVHRVGRTGRGENKGQAFTLHVDNESYKMAVLAEYLDMQIENDILPPFSLLDKTPYKANMVTLQIDGGKKQKVRPGDIVGALTGDNGIAFKQIGKIDMFDNCAYVAVERDAAKPALKKISEGKLKGRSFRVRRIRG
ncbi:MAG: ATP-dependent RNA helicase DbpA [Gammaproteobacteria bacterium]|nr:ATP-dependent RNA helicase DbpA [Gammaproteobacteria bacterium]